MNKWITQFLEKEPDGLTDNTDIFTVNSNLSVLSVPHQGYLDQNSENKSPPSTDSTDIFNLNPNLSVLSVPHQGYLDQNSENKSPPSTDSTEIFNLNPNLSVLSVPHQGYLDQNLENMPAIKPDITDKTNSGGYLSGLSGPPNGILGKTSCAPLDYTSLRDEYEERLAIAEYDGLQSSSQAEHIAYLDAFMTVLVNLPHKDSVEDWLPQRIRSAQAWLLEQGIRQPE